MNLYMVKYISSELGPKECYIVSRNMANAEHTFICDIAGWNIIKTIEYISDNVFVGKEE